MCDDGRLGYHYVNSSERFLRPQARADGRLVPAAWTEVTAAVRTGFREAAGRDGGSVVGVVSPFLTCEEAYLFARWLRGLSPAARLALGPVPVAGEDDTYPKDCRGNAVRPVKFTIRAEKCPNRKGVEAVLRHFQQEVVPFDRVVEGASGIKALYLAAGYPPRPGGWITEAQAGALKAVPLVVCQDLFPSPATAAARYVVPAAAWAEKEGTFVNHAGLAQAILRAVAPAGEVRTDGQVFLDLLERRGLVHAPTLRKELAAEVAYFRPLAGGDLGEYGIQLDQGR